MEYTVWPDSSDPPDNNSTEQNPSYFEDEGFNVSFDHDLNMLEYQNSTSGLAPSGNAAINAPNTDAQDYTLPEQWEDNFTDLNALNSFNRNYSVMKDPMDPSANAPIYYDDSSLHSGFSHEIPDSNVADPSANPQQQSQSRYGSHRREHSDAFSMRVPLVHPSHHDGPTPRSNHHNIHTSFQHNPDAVNDFYTENFQYAPGSGDAYSPDTTSNVYNTPVRVPPSSSGAGRRNSPTLARDSPTDYLQKGLESPMEYSGLDSPYISYQPFPMVPHPSSQVSKQSRRRVSGPTRARRTSSSASQSSVSSTLTGHDALDQPLTPLARASNSSTSSRKPLAATASSSVSGSSSTSAPSTTTTPRASYPPGSAMGSDGLPGSKTPKLEWETPRAENSERAWHTPGLSETPLSSRAPAPSNIPSMESASMRTPSVSRTPSVATPSLISPSQEATSLQNTPLQTTTASPSQATPTQQAWYGKRDGRRRIGRKQIEILEDFFHKNPHPERTDRQNLAIATSLEQRTVQIWFQNRRAKTRAMKMPPSRADTSDEANHYRAAAAAASNAAAAAMSGNANLARSKSTAKTGSNAAASAGASASASANARSASGSPANHQPRAAITSPLSSGTRGGAASRGAAPFRGKSMRPPVSRSRSAITTHRHSSSTASNSSMDLNNPNELMMEQDFWNNQGAQYPAAQPNFQRTSSLTALPRPASMGNLGPVPEDLRQSRHGRSHSVWQSSAAVSPSASQPPVGYHQQLYNATSQQQTAQQAQMLQQRMQQLQRMQHLRQLKNKNQQPVSSGTRGRSSSMYEPMMQYTGFSGDPEMESDYFSGTHPSRSDSIASLTSVSSAVPPSPLMDQQGQYSPDLRSIQNSPDLNSVTSWNANYPSSSLFSADWTLGAGDQRLNIQDNAPNWGTSYQELEQKFPPMNSASHYVPDRRSQSVSVAKQQHQPTGGLAASAAAAAIKSSQRRGSVQPGQRSRQPSIRLQLDESNNAAQLVVVPAEADSNLPRFSDETDWVHGHLTQGNQSDDSPGRAERAAKRLIGDRVTAAANEQK